MSILIHFDSEVWENRLDRNILDKHHTRLYTSVSNIILRFVDVNFPMPLIFFGHTVHLIFHLVEWSRNTKFKNITTAATEQCR